MNAILRCFLVFLATCILYAPSTLADTLFFTNGRTVAGKVIQTNGEDVLVLAPYAAYNYSRSHIKEIQIDPENVTDSANTNRLFAFRDAILRLSKQFWATNITPIPATVIDKGILRNVPYSSFQCGENYEVNIYGDLEHPAGIEIGFYKTLTDDQLRKANCIKFVSALLAEPADKDIVQALDQLKDIKTRNDLTFEITPPTADDSYHGWWISVYSEQQLNMARASDLEMKSITVSKLDAAKQSGQGDVLQWSADQLNLARNSVPTTLTFTNKYRDVISNATVRIYEKGVSIIWDKDGSGGIVLLADLPADLQNRFGYDAAKTEAAEASKKEKAERWRQALEAQALAAQAAQQSATAQTLSTVNSSDGGNYSGGGSVYVHGYTRSNGTYVEAYTRSYPHHR
jgi:hypothetical protein